MSDDAAIDFADELGKDAAPDSGDPAIDMALSGGGGATPARTPMSGWYRAEQNIVGGVKEFGRQVGASTRIAYGAGDSSDVPLREQNEATRRAIGHAVAHPIDTAKGIYSGAVDATSRWMDRAFQTPTTPEQAQDQGGAYLQGAEAVAPVAIGIGRMVRGAPAAAPEADSLQSKLNEHYAGQSMGAAASSPQLTNMSAPLRSVVEDAVANGKSINSEALARHYDADTLPVPTRLSKGQATQDDAIFSDERNLRGDHEELRTHATQQNQNLIDNLQEMRDQVGPDVSTTNKVEHGEALIDAYKEKDAPILADIDAKYQALRDANGGKFPVDAPTLLSNIKEKLGNELLTDDAPKSQMTQLEKLSDSNSMTFEKYLALRRNLSEVSRTSANGNERKAASLMIGELENLPLQEQAANLKPLADSARQAARARFQALDSDPAYKAAVHGTEPPDTFVDRFLTGNSKRATVDQATTMRNAFKDNPKALQTMSVAALDKLRGAAGISEDYTGNFTQSGYNKAVERLGPRLRVMAAPDAVENFEKLGRVARYEQFQTKGSLVNNSNTSIASGAAKMARGALATVAEGAANTKTLGFGGTIVRKTIGKAQEKSYVRKLLAPGAGITSD